MDEIGVDEHNEFSKELLLAKELAISAGEIVLKYYDNVLRGEFTFEFKGLRDFVTQADRESEEHVVSGIKKAFPDHEIVSEEGSGQRGTGTKWLIDPVDGTDNLIIGVPWFAVSIGVEKYGKLFCGVVYNPVTKELYYAERGKGAYLNGKPIRARTDRKYPGIFVVFQMSKKKPEKREQGLKFFTFYFNRALSATNHDCMPLDFCKVASGQSDLFVGNGGWPWDFAAGILICEEAGAAFSHPSGMPLDIYLRGDKAGFVVAANQEMLDSAVADMKQFWPSHVGL